MSRDPRNYNGLHLPGGVSRRPIEQTSSLGLGDQQEQAKRAIALEMQAITREIYVRAASDLVNHSPDIATAEALQELARLSKVAGRAFFIGLGVIEEEATEEPAE